jgi:hypothetical protein
MPWVVYKYSIFQGTAQNEGSRRTVIFQFLFEKYRSNFLFLSLEGKSPLLDDIEHPDVFVPEVVERRHQELNFGFFTPIDLSYHSFKPFLFLLQLSELLELLSVLDVFLLELFDSHSGLVQLLLKVPYLVFLVLHELEIVVLYFRRLAF